jgi:hypothetical protein
MDEGNKKTMKRKSSLISVNNSLERKGFKIVHVGYLGRITPRQLNFAILNQAHRLSGKTPVVIVTKDGVPSFWACAIITDICARAGASFVAIDTRERARGKKSCVIVHNKCPEHWVGEFIANPDGAGNSHRHTGVANKR